MGTPFNTGFGNFTLGSNVSQPQTATQQQQPQQGNFGSQPGTNIISLGGLPTQSSNQPQGIPASQPATAAVSAWSMLTGKSGKKSSKNFANLLETAWSSAGLTEDEKYAVMSLFKTLPLGDEATITNQFNTNLQSAVNEHGQDIASSRPNATRTQLLPVFISANKKLLARLGSNSAALKWGTLSQISYFIPLKASMTIEYSKVAPQAREFLLKKLYYNLADFDVAMKIIDMRWTSFGTATAILAKFGTFADVQAGAQAPNGRTIISAHVSYTPGTGLVPVKVEPNTQEGNVSLDAIITKGDDSNIWYYVAGAACPDYMMLLQTVTIRKGGLQQDVQNRLIMEIMKRMYGVIKLAGFAGKIDLSASYNLNPQEEFCQIYYEAKSYCSATLRGLTAGLFGSTGGPAARSDLRHVDYSQIPDDVTFRRWA